MISWNGRIKGLVEGLEREIALYMLRSGAFRWWNKRLRIDFGVCMGRSLTAWYELKGEIQDVVWCKADRKYNGRKGERDKFQCGIKAVSVSTDIEADWDALERVGLSSWWE